jgi:hypothetical protein
MPHRMRKYMADSHRWLKDCLKRQPEISDSLCSWATRHCGIVGAEWCQRQ